MVSPFDINGHQQYRGVNHRRHDAHLPRVSRLGREGIWRLPRLSTGRFPVARMMAAPQSDLCDDSPQQRLSIVFQVAGPQRLPL